MKWPWSKRETRSSVGAVSTMYIDARRANALSGGVASLSATVATCAGIWSRSFAMLVPEPSDTLTPDHLAAIGLDLFQRGQSLWHIGVDGFDLTLRRAAFWDEYTGGRYNLTIPTPNGTDTIRALEGEVLKLTINAAPEAPWQGRSPLAFMGLSPSLLADLEHGGVVAHDEAKQSPDKADQLHQEP